MQEIQNTTIKNNTDDGEIILKLVETSASVKMLVRGGSGLDGNGNLLDEEMVDKEQQIKIACIKFDNDITENANANRRYYFIPQQQQQQQQQQTFVPNNIAYNQQDGMGFASQQLQQQPLSGLGKKSKLF